jgi:hypothetical protein
MGKVNISPETEANAKAFQAELLDVVTKHTRAINNAHVTLSILATNVASLYQSLSTTPSADKFKTLAEQAYEVAEKEPHYRVNSEKV